MKQEVCLICQELIIENDTNFFGHHLRRVHKISVNEYYDRFFKKEKDGKCIICISGDTKFISPERIYRKTCSRFCGTKLRELNLFKESGLTNISQISSIKEKKIKTCIKNFGCKHPMLSTKIKEKHKKTVLSKYGVENVSQNPEIIKKRHDTIINRYGKFSFAQTKEFRELQEKAGIWIPLNNKSDFEIYSMLVWSITNKIQNQLFDNWNGKCHYSNVFLVTDKKKFQDPLYATIDHKTSIYYGYVNKIPPEQIGGIKNLCLCSRKMNSKKKILTEEQFKSKI